MCTKIIDTPRGPVEYSDAGAGEPILYFHGTGVTGEAMIPVESPLIEGGFRLIIPNRPGYGRSPLSVHHSAADTCAQSAALLRALNVHRAHVMGSSGGATFAISFAVNYPGQTKSLVLLCPQIHRWDHKRWLPASSRWTLPLLKRSFLRKLLLKLYRLQFLRMSPQQFLKMEAGDRYSDVVDDPEVISFCESSLAAMAHGIQFPGFENDFRIFLNEDVLSTSESIKKPTLVIHDPIDPIAPVCHVDWLVSKVRHCERVSLRTAGHLIWVGPDAKSTYQARARFLRDVD